MNNFLICPHCNKEINYEQLTSNAHAVKQLDELIRKREDEFKRELRDTLTLSITNEIKLKLTEEFSKKELEYQKLLADAKINTQFKESEILSLKEKEKILRKEIEFEFEVKKNSAEKALIEKIHDLELANQQNKIIQNKTKGENFEHEVEEILRKTFMDDVIEKITDKDQKADYLHIIRKNNVEIGRIVYEVKNADPESFTFVSHMIKKIIIIENELKNNKDDKGVELQIKKFNDFKEVKMNTINNMFELQTKRISTAENSITKQVDEIRIARETIVKE
ncbi:hypothetical protein FQR65_LT17020 [Abscondita terminalis]|nr:hypothetical protein FQR65_LT17020 [Abscondita terminalis]